jgi:signal transduction histidine kinase
VTETILIVDDTAANLSVLVETLGAAGYQLMVAEDGEEALSLTMQAQPDLILLDVMMPGLDGFETCRRLKARPQCIAIPVLFMTALSDTADKVKAFTAGGVDYITKPFHNEEVLARVKTHLALRGMHRELEAQLAYREKFIRIASHDLRNPLCLIQLAGSIALSHHKLSPEVAKIMANIGESANHMSRIVDTFLNMRAQGPDGWTGAKVDMNTLAQAIVQTQEPAAVRKKISLHTVFAEALPPVLCDVSHPYQALTNLISNALKFTPVGGRVTVTTQLSGDCVRAEVRDSGPGVPSAERSQLFQEHARLSPRPTAGEESHGLGLSIVKLLIEGQSGTVGASFPEAGGSVFWFQLPASR